jgi:hypothetical protein
MLDVVLTPLRKNSRQASYCVYSDTDGVTHDHVYYATLREALKHCLERKDGNILQLGKPVRLVAFWCHWTDSMRFGFGAGDYFKREARDIWWVKWNEYSL